MPIYKRQVYIQMEREVWHSRSNHEESGYEYATVKPILALNDNEQAYRHAQPSLLLNIISCLIFFFFINIVLQFIDFMAIFWSIIHVYNQPSCTAYVTNSSTHTLQYCSMVGS